MDAEARGYGNWLDEGSEECASASSAPPQAEASRSGTAAAPAAPASAPEP